MDAAAWQRGDRHVLAAQVASVLPLVWEIARGGFVHARDPRVHVLGVADGDRAERLVAEIIASALAPGARAVHEPESPAWRTLLLKRAAEVLDAHARAHGGEVTLGPDAETPPVPDLERPELMTSGLPAARDLDARARAEALVACAGTLDLTAEDHAIVEGRWKRGQPVEVVARELGVSPRRVQARERIIRRHLRHQALAQGIHAGLPDLDAALAGETATHALDLPTRERITRAVLTRVDPTPPRSTASRTTWAFGTLALGLVLGLLMYLDVLPSPEDDPAPTPAVTITCDGPCTAGATARVQVAAPRQARRVAVSVLDASGAPAAWIADPMGRSLPLPAIARRAPAMLSRTLVIPPGKGELRAVAVFSKRRLDRPELMQAVAGEAPQGAHAAWSTVTVE